MIEHKIPTTAELKAYHHALAFTIARLANQDLIHDIKVAINSALNNGTSLADFTKQLRPYLIKQGWISDNKQLARRLAIIYDTNLSTAYAQGRWQKIQDTKQLLPYLQYMSSTAKHKRDEHTAYYGLIRHVDDPIWRSIFPPNGFGCKCWVKQLTAQEAQDLGISDDDTVAKLPKPEFDTNHDRLTSLLRLASDRHGSAFGERLKASLDEFMLDLVFEPNFTKDIKTVVGNEFATRFTVLQQLIKAENGSRENSMDLRKKYAKGENYAVATISPSIQELLGTSTTIVWLSDDTIIKMLAHHPELHDELLQLFKDTQMILKNALKVVQKDDLNVIYFSVQDNNYIATIKATRDKSELYLTTIYKIDNNRFQKEMDKVKDR